MKTTLAALILCAACIEETPFVCSSNESCSGAGRDSRCEPTGFCSVEDSVCPSGRRYVEFSGTLSRNCVAAIDVDMAAAPIDGSSDDLTSDGPAALACDTTGAEPGSPWPMRGRCASHQGRSPFVGPQAATMKWSFPTGGRSNAAVAADGTIYVGGDQLYAVRPDGTQKWAFPHAAFSASPAIGTDGTVYVGSLSFLGLYAVNPDGSEKWFYDTGDVVLGGPTIGSDGTIYIGSDTGSLFALRPDGTLRWSSGDTQGVVRTAPALAADGAVYFGSQVTSSSVGKVYAVTVLGSEGWVFPTLGRVNSSPAIGSDGAVYFGSLDGNLYHLTADGSRQPNFVTTGIDSSPAIDADGTIYVGSYDHNLYALRSDGQVKWAFPVGAQVSSSPTIGADGTIYIAEGSLMAIGP